MFRLAAICLVFSLSAKCNAWQSSPTVTPDLSKYTFEQLKSCYSNARVCGTKDYWFIADELARRLPQFSDNQLFDCFDDWEICGVGDDTPSGFALSDEVARRGNVSALLYKYWYERRPSVRAGIEHVASHFDTPEVTAFMRRVMTRRVNDGENRYYVLTYLARKCDLNALEQLSTGRGRGSAPGLVYAQTVELFGKCGFRQAIPYLVNVAVYDFSGNVAASADRSMHLFYPDAPQDFHTWTEMKDYWCARARKDGYKVKCTNK